jgi:transcriptional regulator with XRE-family HTH domain
MNNNVFGDWLKQEREERRMTQAELAARIKTTQADISRLENGTRQPLVTELAPIFRALGLNPSVAWGVLEEFAWPDEK